MSGSPAREPLLVVSPHLDDAVFGCGRLIAQHPGSTVLTVFAGRPPAQAPLTAWDSASGFAVGEDVVGCRRAEDRAALTLLGARPLWFDFLDAQYGARVAVAEVATVLDRALSSLGAGSIVMPLGLFHSDHVLTHEACLALLRRDGRCWLAYEDAMYRTIPALLAQRFASLHAAGIAVAAAGTLSGADDEPKRRAVAAYASQLRALATPGRPGHLDAFAPERIWRLDR